DGGAGEGSPVALPLPATVGEGTGGRGGVVGGVARRIEDNGGCASRQNRRGRERGGIDGMPFFGHHSPRARRVLLTIPPFWAVCSPPGPAEGDIAEPAAWSHN